MIRLATAFSGIGAIEQALKRLNIDYKIIFACDNGDVEIFEVDGFDHYIFTNNGKNVAVWHSDNLEYSLSTTLSISELKIILESMYQE